MWNKQDNGYYSKYGVEGEHKADSFEMRTGLVAERASKASRKLKWDSVHSYLRVRDELEMRHDGSNLHSTKIVFSDRCKRTIKQLKFTQTDTERPYDIIRLRDENNIKDDHLIDALAAHTLYDLGNTIKEEYAYKPNHAQHTAW